MRCIRKSSSRTTSALLWPHRVGCTIPPDAAAYDRARALLPADVLAWVRETQPKAWDGLVKSHGAAAEATLLDRIRKQLDDRGALDVIRFGVELLGLRQPLALAQFQARPRSQCRTSGPLRRQSPAGGAAGALFLAQREQHRSGAVPQRHSGGDGGTEGRLHPIGGRRRRSVSLRPRPQAQGAGNIRTAAGLPARCPGAFRRQQFSRADDHPASKGRSPPSCPSTRATRVLGCGQSAQPERPRHVVPVGGGLGAGELAGNPRALCRRDARCEKADREGDLPPLSPARRNAEAARRGACRGWRGKSI